MWLEGVEKYGMDWINAAHGGATIAQDPDVVNIPGQLDYDYLEGRTIDYVIIEGGINDAARNSNSAAIGVVGSVVGNSEQWTFGRLKISLQSDDLWVV